MFSVVAIGFALRATWHIKQAEKNAERIREASRGQLASQIIRGLEEAQLGVSRTARDPEGLPETAVLKP